jgi:hypothetical protein
MPKVQLTAAAVERFKAKPGSRIEYFDKLLPGFALRVSGPSPSNPAGSKSWVVFYRFGGRLRRDTIGKWPVLDLGDAREKARNLLAVVSENRDPHPTKQISQTIDVAVDEFMKRHMAAHKRSASYIKETRRILTLSFYCGGGEDYSGTFVERMYWIYSTKSPTGGRHRKGRSLRKARR